MQSNPPADLQTKLDLLIREVEELRRRVAALERLVGASAEHNVDRSVVQGKVSYDWQK